MFHACVRKKNSENNMGRSGRFLSESSQFLKPSTDSEVLAHELSSSEIKLLLANPTCKRPCPYGGYSNQFSLLQPSTVSCK